MVLCCCCPGAQAPLTFVQRFGRLLHAIEGEEEEKFFLLLLLWRFVFNWMIRVVHHISGRVRGRKREKDSRLDSQQPAMARDKDQVPLLLLPPRWIEKKLRWIINQLEGDRRRLYIEKKEKKNSYMQVVEFQSATRRRLALRVGGGGGS